MAGMTADEVYVLLGDEITLLTEEVKQMEGWEPIEHKGTVQTAEDLPADAKKGWMYNIATDSVYGAAGMNVVMTSKGWDPMGPIINMNLYLTKEEGTKSFQPKGNYLSGTDTDLKESGKAADAKATGEKIAKNSSDIAKKLGKNQGSENSGKVAGINEVGDIVPMFPMGVEYNSETNCLEFGSDQKMKLNQGIGLDNTLTKSGSAADAGVTGKKIDSLKEDISTKITKFYASSQGETHLADSDNGKIMDMMLYGKSEQKQYTGYQLLNDIFEKGSIDVNTGELVESDSNLRTKFFSKIEAGKEYHIELPKDVTIAFRYYADENTYISSYAASNSTRFSTPESATLLKAVLINNNIYSNNILLSDVMDRYIYEPYTGGQSSPSPNYPQEIKSVVNPTVKVTNEDGLKVQSVTLNNITLNAIPVSSGGNVTINGQQYIADYVDVEREKLVKKLKSFTISDIEAISTWGINENADNITGFYFYTSENGLPKTNNDVMTSTILRYVDGTWGGKNVGCAMSSDSYNNYAILSVPTNMLEDISSDENACASLVKICENTNAIFFYSMASPIETDLTPEEIEAFKELVTYYPVTNISVNSEQLDGYTVFNYPISMKNGWDYVKKQLNDNRDYIYNMDTKTQDIDTQAAEAYVNSEYAVALTELEV